MSPLPIRKPNCHPKGQHPAGRDASSHIALGSGFPFLIEDGDRDRGNKSVHHTTPAS